MIPVSYVTTADYADPSVLPPVRQRKKWWKLSEIWSEEIPTMSGENLKVN